MFLALVADNIKNKGIAIPIVPNSETTKVFTAASSLEIHSTERDAAEDHNLIKMVCSVHQNTYFDVVY